MSRVEQKKASRIKNRACSVQAALLIAVMLLSGCVLVGPDYEPPESSLERGWNASDTKQLRGTADSEALACWWKAFDDEVLSKLIEQGLENALDVKQAQARVREARARRRISSAGLFPSLDATALGTFAKTSDEINGDDTSERYESGFDAGWEIDLFGSVRRGIEATQADLEASEESLRDVQVSLSAEIALSYVELRTLQQRLAVAKKSLELQSESYDLTLYRAKSGLGSELDVEQARYNLEDTRSTIPELERDIEQAKNRLAVLSGFAPGELRQDLSESASVPEASRSITIGIPAEVLRRRPDVRQAERELAAQTARIGVATAELYPKLTLSGSIGVESVSLGNLFDFGTWFLSAGPRISWNVFDAGAIRSNIEVQNALQEQALIQYESAVLGALEEVENALVAYVKEEQSRESLKKAAEGAKRAADLASLEYSSGLSDFTSVLETERSLLSFKDRLVQSRGSSALELIRLYKAAGGGWNSLSESGEK